MNLPKIAYFGSDAICLPGLRFLYEQCSELCELELVVSQPDRRQGRGKQLKQNPVAAYASKAGILLSQPEKPNREWVEAVQLGDLCLGFVMAYGHFLPKSVREAPTHGLLNFHGSLLPSYRGASPVETALAMGETETGVCLMEIAQEMDAGAVAGVERIGIHEEDYGADLRARMGEAVVPLIERHLAAALLGGLDFEAQDASRATFCRKISKQDGALDFNQPAHLIDCRLRAFTPWPGGFFEIRETSIRVGRAKALPVRVSKESGTVLLAGETLDIATTDGVICFEELQRPGGRMLPTEDFLRGFPIEVGEVLPSVASDPLLV